MPGLESNELLREIVRDFETLAAQLEHAIEVFAHDESGTFNLRALHRARGAAWRGAELSRNGQSNPRAPLEQDNCCTEPPMAVRD